jgi:UDP-N-acetylmuramate--alanine ligase
MFWTKERKPRIHMIGIGGSGMSGIAEVLLASGFQVSGSDLATSPILRRLESLGARIFIGHQAENLEGADCVVISSAISSSNDELVAARKSRTPVIPRAEMLAELMRLKRGIAVAGSHGKTTTTCILGQLLQSLKPTVVVGGRVQSWDSSSLIGRSSLFVVEADESDRSFLQFSPVFTIVTNIDAEHLDNYRDLEDVEDCFTRFLNQTAFFGEAWLNRDCGSSRRVAERVEKPIRWYGSSEDCDLQIRETLTESRGSRFRLFQRGEDLGEFYISLPGLHNIWNATAAIGVALRLGIGMTTIKRRLAKTQGAERRLEIHWEDESYAVVEDYAHHPTELRAALSSLKLMYPSKPLVVLFQPHRYTRTKALWADFVRVFPEHCDELHLLPIYGAHEPVIEGVSSENMVAEWNRPEFVYRPKLGLAKDFSDEIRSRFPSAVVAVLGAGPLRNFAQALGSELKSLSRSMASD